MESELGGGNVNVSLDDTNLVCLWIIFEQSILTVIEEKIPFLRNRHRPAPIPQPQRVRVVTISRYTYGVCLAPYFFLCIHAPNDQAEHKLWLWLDGFQGSLAGVAPRNSSV